VKSTSQVVPEALMDSQDQLARRQFADQHSQGGAVVAGDERIAGARDDIGRRNLAQAPEGGSVV